MMYLFLVENRTQLERRCREKAVDPLLRLDADKDLLLCPNAVAEMFPPFTQAGVNNSGLGLGLSTARRSVQANAGHAP